MIGANDLEASRKFYDAVLGTLNIPAGIMNKDMRYFYRSPTGTFSITRPIDGQSATHANGGTIGFLADSPANRNFLQQIFAHDIQFFKVRQLAVLSN